MGGESAVFNLEDSEKRTIPSEEKEPQSGLLEFTEAETPEQAKGEVEEAMESNVREVLRLNEESEGIVDPSQALSRLQEAGSQTSADLEKIFKTQEEKKITKSEPTMYSAEGELMKQKSEQIPEESGVREKDPRIEMGEASIEEEREVLRARIAELLGHEPRGETLDEIRMYEFSQPIKLNDPKLKEKMEARRLLDQLMELEMKELDEEWEMAAIAEAVALGMERSPGLPETLPMAPEISETLPMEEGVDAIRSLREAKKQGRAVETIEPRASDSFNKDSAKTKLKQGGILGIWGVGKVLGWGWKGVMGFLDGMQKYILRSDLDAGISEMFRDIKARFSRKNKE